MSLCITEKTRNKNAMYERQTKKSSARVGQENLIK